MISQISSEVSVEKTFLVMRETPLGHDRAAAPNDSGRAFSSQRNVAQENAGVNREIVDALLACSINVSRKISQVSSSALPPTFSSAW